LPRIFSNETVGGSLFDNAAAMMHQYISGAPRDRYTRVAIVLHWAIAAFIIFNLCTGFFIESWLHGKLMEGPPTQIRWMSLVLHASSGLTVLALTLARVVWRLLNDPPPYPAGMKLGERRMAHVAHFLLYAAMVLMPLTGWAILSAHPPPGSRGAAAAAQFAPPAAALPPGVKPGAALAPGVFAPPPGAPRAVMVWNLVPMPAIAPIEAIGEEPGGVAAQHVLHEEFAEWHRVGGYLLIGVLVLHIVGALKHQFIDRQSEFARMGIGRRKSSRAHERLIR
jgi:cytochrome b561